MEDTRLLFVEFYLCKTGEHWPNYFIFISTLQSRFQHKSYLYIKIAFTVRQTTHMMKSSVFTCLYPVVVFYTAAAQLNQEVVIP